MQAAGTELAPAAAGSTWSCESEWHTLHGKGATELDDIHRAALISQHDCEWIVQQCELHVGSQGWQQSLRHKAAPTTDLEVESVPALHEWHQQWLQTTLFPMVSRIFSVSEQALIARESFVVRYAADEQRELNWHRDGAVLSFVAALNAPPAYCGGGTQFWTEQQPICSLAKGEVLLFHGQLLEHRAAPVTDGTRFVLAGFMDLAVPPSVVIRSSQELKLTQALASALLSHEQQAEPAPTVPLFQSLFYGLASVAGTREAEMAQVEGPRHLCVQVDSCSGGSKVVTAAAEAVQMLVSSTMRGLQQQARVRLVPLDVAAAAPAPLHVSQVAQLLGHSAPLPEIQTTLHHHSSGAQLCGTLFVLENGMLAFKLEQQAGCIRVSTEQVIEHCGWFSDSASWQLLPSATGGSHQLRSHSCGLFLTLGGGELAVGPEGVDAEWKVETRPAAPPTVHRLEVPVAVEQPEDTARQLLQSMAWSSDTCRNLLAIPAILGATECTQLIRAAESVGFCPEREGVRQNEMVQILIPSESRIHQAVAARLLPMLPRSPGGARASGLNPRWRFYRYHQGDQFLPHYDQASEIDQHGTLLRSRMSVLFYLTGDLSGAGTRFWTPVADEWMVSTVTPAAGTAICFWHGDHVDSVLHEGCALEDASQTKIVIRTDVMWATCGTNDSSSQSK